MPFTRKFSRANHSTFLIPQLGGITSTTRRPWFNLSTWFNTSTSIFFSALAQGLQQVVLEEHGNYIVTPPIWAKSLTFALHRLFDYTRARPPSRTLIDPLAAFIGNLSDSESGVCTNINAGMPFYLVPLFIELFFFALYAYRN